VSTEVNMVLLMRGEQNGTPQVKFQPARFNLDTREGKLRTYWSTRKRCGTTMAGRQ
jgi:hypothetical protein